MLYVNSNTVHVYENDIFGATSVFPVVARSNIVIVGMDYIDKKKVILYMHILILTHMVQL